MMITERTVYESLNPEIKTLEDLETWVTMDDFELVGYEHHDPVKYPFTV